MKGKRFNMFNGSTDSHNRLAQEDTLNDLTTLTSGISLDISTIADNHALEKAKLIDLGGYYLYDSYDGEEVVKTHVTNNEDLTWEMRDHAGLTTLNLGDAGVNSGGVLFLDQDVLTTFTAYSEYILPKNVDLLVKFAFFTPENSLPLQMNLGFSSSSMTEQDYIALVDGPDDFLGAYWHFDFEAVDPADVMSIIHHHGGTDPGVDLNPVEFDLDKLDGTGLSGLDYVSDFTNVRCRQMTLMIEKVNRRWRFFVEDDLGNAILVNTMIDMSERGSRRLPQEGYRIFLNANTIDGWSDVDGPSFSFIKLYQKTIDLHRRLIGHNSWNYLYPLTTTIPLLTETFALGIRYQPPPLPTYKAVPSIEILRLEYLLSTGIDHVLTIYYAREGRDRVTSSISSSTLGTLWFWEEPTINTTALLFPIHRELRTSNENKYSINLTSRSFTNYLAQYAILNANDADGNHKSSALFVSIEPLESTATDLTSMTINWTQY